MRAGARRSGIGTRTSLPTRELSVAALGTLSLDGSQVQHGKWNDEAKLVKYGVPVEQSQAPYARRLMLLVCPH